MKFASPYLGTAMATARAAFTSSASHAVFLCDQTSMATTAWDC